jgi:hypothetical protein
LWKHYAPKRALKIDQFNMGANGERRNVNSNRQDRGSRVIKEIALGRAELAILVFTIFGHGA